MFSPSYILKRRIFTVIDIVKNLCLKHYIISDNEGYVIVDTHFRKTVKLVYV